MPKSKNGLKISLAARIYANRLGVTFIDALTTPTNNRIFVTKVNANEHQGWLHKDIWDWINARL